jgi:hypothetical protein
MSILCLKTAVNYRSKTLARQGTTGTIESMKIKSLAIQEEKRLEILEENLPADAEKRSQIIIDTNVSYLIV